MLTFEYLYFFLPDALYDIFFSFYGRLCRDRFHSKYFVDISVVNGVLLQCLMDWVDANSMSEEICRDF